MRNRNIAALLLGALCTCWWLPAAAQNDDWKSQVEKEAPGWYRMKASSQISFSDFLNNHLDNLGLNPDVDSYTIKDQWTGTLGITHYRLQQMHRGVPVEGGELLLHEKHGRLVSANGEVVTQVQGSGRASISAEEALSSAEAFVGAEKYLYKDPAQLAFFKDILGSDEGLKPDPRLVFTDPVYSKKGGNYRLAYKIDIFASEPMSRQYVFVDAQTGEVLHSLSRIHHTNDTGIAVTRYHGIRPIITDSVAPSLYRLRQSVSGGGIETFDLNKGTSYNSAVDFLDSNNYWDNFNAEQDEVATDAHWGARMTYEYYLHQHGRNSYDDQGSKLVSFVHYDSNYVNAFWNGQFMTYGDGNAGFSPLTALDVVAHELTHGVTGNSAGLIYRGESGALNESFSDIFGATVEFYNDSANGDWIIGEEMNAQGLRNMSNPKPYGDPDTYRGQNWGYGVFIDNGYVHSNSGVQNFWYHLLTEGGTGVNDLGAYYVVNGIGLEKAAAIAYRNLTTYLTSSSDHFDARQGSIQAASDLYGSCSPEALATANAWYAVGLGEPLRENDLAVVELLVDDFLCGADTAEDLGVVIKNLSCAQSIPSGDTIELSFSTNNGSFTTEQVVLNGPLAPGATFIYNFNAGADFSLTGTNRVNVGLAYKADSNAVNDSILQFPVENRQVQNSDFGLLSILSPVSSCDLSDSTDLVVRLFFSGCDSISAGANINFEYRLNNGALQQASYTLKQNLYTFDTLVVAIPGLFNLSAGGRTELDLSLANANDPNPSNDEIANFIFTNPLSITDRVIKFENIAVRDSLAIIQGSMANVKLNSYPAHSTGIFGMMMTGGNAIDYPDGVEFPTKNDVWAVNPEFFSSACACVDARDMDGIDLTFDLRQRYSRIYQQVLHRNIPYASAFRLMVNGTQVGNTKVASTPDNDSFQTLHYDLSDYAGSRFSLCFEAKTLMNRNFNRITGDGDEVHIDNIFLNAQYVDLREFTVPAGLLSVYPNPSAGAFWMAASFENPQDVHLVLTDLSGKILMEEIHFWKAGETRKFEMDLPAGTYLLSWKLNGQSHTEKLMIR